MDELSEQNWCDDFVEMNVNEMWTHFKTKLQKACENHIPFVTRRSRRRGPLWGNEAASRAVKKKQKLWRRYRRGMATEAEY